MQETWLSIPGYVGFYEASNLGRIRSVSRSAPRSNHSPLTLTGRVLKQQTTSWGYKSAWLSVGGNQKLARVHRLVAMSFLENPTNMPEVNHINGIKADNQVSNLEWVTRSENSRHAISTGLIDFSKGEDRYNTKMTTETVLELRLLRSQGSSLKDLSARYGICQTAVSAIANRKNWNHV